MNGADEQDLRDRLEGVLMTITPRPAPVDSVMRQGRHVIYRRRASVAGGLAAVAVVAVAVPAALNQDTHGQSQPSAVTVFRPGPASLAGLIASGTVGARRWSVRVTGHGCVSVAGAATACGVEAHPGPPAVFAGVGGDGLTTEYGPVRPSVTRVTVQLGDGQLLVLHPVSAAGARWVAFPVPAGTQVRRVTAYAGAAELAHAIPFNGPSGTSSLPSITTWLPPGAAGHPRVTVRLGAGIVEYAGPWGRCFTTPVPHGSSSYCTPGFGSELSNGQSVSVLIRPFPGHGPGTYLATVKAQVSHVEVNLSGGQVLRPSIIAGADGEKFFTFAVGQGQHLQSLVTSPEQPRYSRVTSGLPLAAGPGLAPVPPG